MGFFNQTLVLCCLFFAAFGTDMEDIFASRKSMLDMFWISVVTVGWSSISSENITILRYMNFEFNDSAIVKKYFLLSILMFVLEISLCLLLFVL